LLICFLIHFFVHRYWRVCRRSTYVRWTVVL